MGKRLYYFNARWYDAETGRFITEDPIKDGMNWYAYVRDNPLTRIDIDGLREIIADDIYGNPIAVPIQRQQEYFHERTSIVIQRDSSAEFYNDILSVNIGTQTFQQFSVFRRSLFFPWGTKNTSGKGKIYEVK